MKHGGGSVVLSVTFDANLVIWLLSFILCVVHLPSFLVLELMFLETSALTGENVEEGFLKCARTILNKIESGKRTLF